MRLRSGRLQVSSLMWQCWFLAGHAGYLSVSCGCVMLIISQMTECYHNSDISPLPRLYRSSLWTWRWVFWMAPNSRARGSAWRRPHSIWRASSIPPKSQRRRHWRKRTERNYRRNKRSMYQNIIIINWYVCTLPELFILIVAPARNLSFIT